MLRSKRLEPVLALEERKEQEALERMGEARKLAEAHREQVENLERYQQEYRDQIRANQQGVVPVARLQAWQAFIAQLDQVIAQQNRQLQQAEQVFEVRRKEWQQAWERRRGMEKYIESCRQQEQRDQDMKDQKLADEAAGRAFARRNR
ncbi:MULTISPECIES: flagellar export protein FliJ [Marinobacter]|jgi:flagellar FliJ protein|uniref:Flagellar FliJ protein n=2 Tax=Marinobacter TaxID=2742 RepID=A0A137SCN8_9GAMM|nr:MULTISPECIES: flagellar export protein FliJ [Marinobacter]AMQ90578.1 flagellar export protein FliJ [Marinobacter sp. LQ44]KXO10217.1 Flagellar protein FliJ [Marinobacter excellens LAMA 842]MDX5328914.1 flagellar export protein FliJ [Marinobacter sp.]MDX5336760.1 flagellar export protein FliJ [Marinobacter sp.]MDX5387918.1 flagellar export protein FliJ [Marinobacter sp.]